MKQLEQDVRPTVWAEPTQQNPFGFLSEIISFISKTLVIAELEIRKLRHDPTELLTRAVQPALWLLIFGEVFTRIRAIPTGSVSYIEFMTPGILAQSVLFVSIFYGIAIIWERDLGIVHKFLATPTPPRRTRFRQGAFGGCAQSGAGGHHLRAGRAFGGPYELESAGSVGRDPHCDFRCSLFRDLLIDHCMPR